MNVFTAPSEVKPPEFNEFFSIKQPDGSYKSDYPGYEAAEKQYLEDLATHIRTEFGGHKLAGELVSVPFADGSAVYMIGKVNGKVSLFHIDLMDGWHDDRFCRLATVAELTRMVEQERKFREFWASKQPA